MLLKVLIETDDLKTLSKWCQTSKRVNQICKDEGFWHNKYRKDFGFRFRGSWGLSDLSSELTLTEGETWREQYKRITLGRINSPISAGDNHYGIIDQNGNLYMAGDNHLGQLGVGKYTQESKIPTLVKFPGNPQKIISISTGFRVSGAVTKDGKVYIWGNNGLGLSPSNWDIIWSPKELILTGRAVKMAINIYGYIVLLEDSSIYFYSNKNRPCPTKGYIKLDAIDISINEIGIFSIVTKDHKLYMWGNLVKYMTNERNIIKNPIHIPLPWLVRKVSHRNNYPVVLSTTGDVYSLGLGLSGNRWGGTDGPILIKLPEKIVQIDAYQETFAALSETGKLYMWGDNSYGKITSDQKADFSAPVEISFGMLVNFVSIGDIFTIAVGKDGIVNYWGISNWAPE